MSTEENRFSSFKNKVSPLAIPRVHVCLCVCVHASARARARAHTHSLCRWRYPPSAFDILVSWYFALYQRPFFVCHHGNQPITTWSRLPSSMSGTPDHIDIVLTVCGYSRAPAPSALALCPPLSHFFPRLFHSFFEILAVCRIPFAHFPPPSLSHPRRARMMTQAADVAVTRTSNSERTSG
jgi:hypothetical protein